MKISPEIKLPFQITEILQARLLCFYFIKNTQHSYLLKELVSESILVFSL